MRVAYDIQYRESDDYDPSLNSMDIYFKEFSGRNPQRPLIVFLHGGNWSGGDKNYFQTYHSIPLWFVERGYVFAAPNFRLAANPRSPNARIEDMAADIAKAVKWLTVNGRRFGGRSTQWGLIGYSSGAYLATLLTTHARFLQKQRLEIKLFSGVVSLDGAHFDLPLTLQFLEANAHLSTEKRVQLAFLYKLFGGSRAEQEQLSPAAALGTWSHQTKFLLVSADLYCGQPQKLSIQMNSSFQERLLTHDIHAVHYHFKNQDHVDLLSHWKGDVTACLEDFLSSL